MSGDGANGLRVCSGAVRMEPGAHITCLMTYTRTGDLCMCRTHMRSCCEGIAWDFQDSVAYDQLVLVLCMRVHRTRY